jgi:hypothetical protein
VILAAVPIAASAVIVIVTAVEEEGPSPKAAMPAEIAITASQAREAIAAAYGVITTGSGKAAAARGEAATAYTAAASTSMTCAAPSSSMPADKHEGAIAVSGRRNEKRTCRYGQAKSCRCSYDYSFYIHRVPFLEDRKPFLNEEHRQPRKFPPNL